MRRENEKGKEKEKEKEHLSTAGSLSMRKRGFAVDWLSSSSGERDAAAATVEDDENESGLQSVALRSPFAAQRADASRNAQRARSPAPEVAGTGAS